MVREIAEFLNKLNCKIKFCCIVNSECHKENQENDE